MFREEDEFVTLGGVTTTVAVVRQALATLREAPGVMVKQPLQRAGNPLAAMNYHSISDSVRRAHPEMEWPSGTHREPTAHVKPRVIHHLELTCPACRRAG
jgi:hypothetical protein